MLPPRKSFCITRPCITPAQRAQGLASPLQLAGDNLRGTPHVLLIHIRNEQYTASWMSSTRLLGARVNKGDEEGRSPSGLRTSVGAFATTSRTSTVYGPKANRIRRMRKSPKTQRGTSRIYPGSQVACGGPVRWGLHPQRSANDSIHKPAYPPGQG